MPGASAYLDENEEQPGSVTVLLRQIGRDDPGDDRLFLAAIDQLRRKAALILRGFPQLQRRLDPEDLVNEFTKRLLLTLAPVEIRNRQHFFALASHNFRWILLDMIRQKTLGRIDTIDDIEVADAGPATQAVRSDLYEAIVSYIEETFTQEDQLIFDFRALHGMTFDQIAQELQKPLATVHARYQVLRQRIADRFPTGGNR